MPPNNTLALACASPSWELPAQSIEVVGPSDGAKYPIPPVKINLETLRGITHMRPRTGVMGAVFRVRNRLAFATHEFFQSAGFMCAAAPRSSPPSERSPHVSSTRDWLT